MEKDYLIKKWLNNELSPTEKEAFDKLEDANFYNEIIFEANRFKASENLPRVANFETLSKQLSQKTNTSILKKWQKTAPKIAALLVVGITLFFLLKKEQATSLQTAITQTKTITLPDESVVIINSKSKITYNKKEWSNNRTLNLNGEAFFDVERGSTFSVVTPSGKITVLGTEFNVKQRSNLFEVMCFEGLVKVTHNNKSINLPAGKAFSFFNGKIRTFDIQETEPLWNNTISKFNTTPISEVFDEFERKYNITVDYSQINTSKTFTGGFEHNNLTNALLSITKPLKLNYKKESDNRVIILDTASE